jgi:DNA polymerase III epsilon subunit-like protein
MEEGVEYVEAFKVVQNFIKTHTVGNSKPIIAGHNIGWLPRRIVKKKEVEPNGFDNPFMEIFFENNKADFFGSVNDLIMDTLQMARLKYWELPSFSLGVVANELGLTLSQAHRALPDTVANAQVLIKMLKSLKGDGSSNTKYTREKFDLNY